MHSVARGALVAYDECVMWTDLLDLIPLIRFSWLTTAAVWLATFLVAAMLSTSQLSSRHRRVIVFLSAGGALALVWAGLADLGELAPSGVPVLGPEFLSLWGLGTLGLVPLTFVLLGGTFHADYHPRWAPFAYVSKLVSFVASLVTILGFYLQHGG